MPRLPRFNVGQGLERFRHQLANVDALPQLCVLGVVAGVLTGVLMVGFRSLLELGGLWLFPADSPEAFEPIPPVLRSLMPLGAALLIGLWMWSIPPAGRQVGVVHVIDRLTYHQGRFPLRNWLTQWVVGLISVLGGLSAGREGPAIHLGAAASSGLGQRLRLPHNSLRVLVACGTAAGIAASFNTPIAGVIFAMEVVMMEYTIIGFMPVILASTMGAVVAQMVYGPDPAIFVPDLHLNSLLDLPWIIVSALVIGLLAGLFVRVSRLGDRLEPLPMALRFLMAGGAVAVVAWWYPQVQGMGYDTLQATLSGSVAVDVLIAVAIGKLLLTAGTVACGIPVSIIGPVLVIGGAAGALCGMAGHWLLPIEASDPALFAMLGMAAMMGAVLQAPLAALMALLELTHNPNIILPGMLAVVISCLTARQLCRCSGFFLSVKRQGLHPLQQPLMQALSRVSVPAVMDRRLERTQRMVTHEKARALLKSEPVWILIERSSDEKPILALKAADLARWLTVQEETAREEKENAGSPLEGEEAGDRQGRRKGTPKERSRDRSEPPLVDLLEIPGERLELAPIGLQATLSEAFNKLNDSMLDALYVEHGHRPKQKRISGIITRGAIERFYRVGG
ncbi:chloride channel protein [Halomonas sp. KAO]|uniref:chloride channel protein n=1 Tax=unclassified Halomonas TaxID=2609666 RepID=UPI0018A0986A|nr:MULTISPECIES: chloride channel protein [unclassified Halomonas]MBF7053661.1 chloride channel protein [Halomonas sp. KAO]MDT0500940.1 chloride channel protein [Halomonas sp. PAR7]MDT0512676.1 chloride channel protein [Halomonas sp. LES1]MDT0592006.1 chloride channel protein [Halomonas sp. PAR8]